MSSGLKKQLVSTLLNPLNPVLISSPKRHSRDIAGRDTHNVEPDQPDQPDRPWHTLF